MSADAGEAANGFRGLVQQKRRKMLAFAVLLLVAAPLVPDVGAGINLTYILARDKDRLRPSCVAEEFERYAAVGWVYPLPDSEDDVPDIVTKFVPNIENDYNCKFCKNDLCIKRWIIKDWKIDDNSTKTRDFISDRRWEDLPTIFISNGTKEFNDRIDIEGLGKVGFSVRALGLVELFVCSGWDPYNYPCYYFHVNDGEVFFNKFSAIPHDISINKTTSLTSFEMTKGKIQAFSSVLSSNEWRNFLINFDDSGKIEFIDMYLNRTIIRYTDKEPVTPRYLFMRSQNVSLWKIIENNFIYTETAQISRFGPQLTFKSKNLCVSLLVMTCKNCQMDFFYMDNNVKRKLKHIEPTQEWIEIKLKEENIGTDKILIFIETSFKDNSLNESQGFWAIDDVRVCNENEVKISRIHLKQTMDEKEITEENLSCQIISTPHWRPKKVIYDQIKDFPDVTFTYTHESISLSWKQEDPQNQISYFISYQGIDPCTDNKQDLKRKKSNGFVTTKHNELVLEHLIPYTVYQVNLSSIVHENPKRINTNTAESDEPTYEEIPYNPNVWTTNTTANISWEKPACDAVRGRLLYDIIISSSQLNFTKRMEQQTNNEYYIIGLKPFTTYTLKILTARNARNLYRNVHTLQSQVVFTTKPGVSPPVNNLEVYSADENSVSIRFDLPENSKGVPLDLQLRSCNALLVKKCKPAFYHIQRCKLWPNKYCIDKKMLIPNQNYKFLVSIKNVGTHTFGEEASVETYTMDRVPGAPTNISFKVVDCQNYTDYCHLNISWLHPYNQNGSISLFNIILSRISSNKEYEEEEDIKEVYKVVNDSYYMPQYTHQILYIPYSARYNVSIQSANKHYQSEFTTKEIKTANIGDYVDQSPKLLANSDRALIFQIPHLDHRLSSYTMTVIVQDYNRNETLPKEFAEGKIGDNLCHNFGETWISQSLKVENNNTDKITIGTHHIEEHKIKPNTQYCITFIITNKYKETEHDVVYYEKIRTPEASNPPTKAGGAYYNHLYILLVLLLLVPIGFLVYRYLRKRRILRQPQEPKENVYETLPFDECDNSVANVNYDQLIHK